MLSCLVLGGTGLVGRRLLSQLMGDLNFSPVHSLSRRQTGLVDQKLSEFITPLDQMDSLPKAFCCDVVFCCLGTTIKSAGSKEKFKMVDYHYPLMAAKLALAAGARRFVLVSALGADPDSRVFYSRVKGELERDLMALGFSELIIIRPSVLDGPRSESRPGEALGILLGRLITPLMRGGWAKYRPTKIDELAALMRGLAKGEHCNGQIEYQKLKQGQ